jgi:hypothetical protein
MPSTLASWQDRLENHFSRLKEERSSASGDRPVFALEHGLTDDEISELSAQIRSQSSQDLVSERHWLVWIVYATELGYRYAGDEYWQTFEDETPGWLEHGDRDWIRECFKRFYTTYNGAKPSGSWARHFSIICWPITHAILPEDLQVQLAEILYQIRHLFRKELFESPAWLGAEIAARSWTASRRFQKLAENPLLLGQIATALLVGEKDPEGSLITPDTLVRIAKHLNRERRSREWLKDARTAARVTVSGVTRTISGFVEKGSENGRQQLQALGIEPRVYLRQTLSSTWDVLLEVPDLSPLLPRFPSLQSALSSSCVVSGSNGRPLARGRLLHFGPQIVVLRKWPSSEELLLRFDPQPPELDNILTAECMLRPGPRWLFKILSKGIAQEIRGQIVRPGGKYILLSEEPISMHENVTAVTVNCEGIHAAFIGVPAVLSTEELGHFSDLGLSPAREIRVRPVGLPPVSWDGEGHAEWLSTDEPCICISSDHPLKALTLNLQGSLPERLDLEPQEPGERLFVKLPTLPAGEHVLHILVQSSDDEIRIGRLEVAVRAPRPWGSGLTEQNALLVIPDPPNPSLEQFWESDVKVQVYGPPSRLARCDVRFYSDSVKKSIILDKKLAPFCLPLGSEEWDSYFQENVLNDEAVQRAYDSALGCELSFTAEELGQFTLACQREFSPLRWITRWDNHGYVMRLRDDTGDPSGVRVFRFEFDRPDIPIAMAAESWQRPLRVPDAGGLYCARSTDCMRSIIFPPVLHSFRELRAESILTERPRSAESLCDLVRSFEIWSGASLTGNPFTAHKRAGVLATFNTKIMQMLCGEDWESHEAAFSASRTQLGDLKSAISRKPMEAGFGAALILKYVELAEKGLSDRVAAFSHFARSYLPLTGFGEWPALPLDLYLWTTEFALRLMSRPQTLTAWAAGKMTLGMDYVLKCPSFARGARFFVLAIGSTIGTGPVRRINPPNWEWQ